MINKFLSKTIIALFIFNLVFSPTYFIFATNHDIDVLGGIANPSTGDTSAGLDIGGDAITSQGDSITASRLAGTFGGFSSLLGCKSKTVRDMGGILGITSSLFKNKVNQTETGQQINQKVAAVTGVSVGADNVPVSDARALQKLDDLTKINKDLNKKADEQKVREECLNGLAYRVAKFALAKLTQKTVDWINSGFNGDSFFVRDQNSYLASLQREQMNAILGPIGAYSNRADYPYGREFARSFMTNRVNTYNQTSRSNLGSYLNRNMTPEQYARDFSSGGWAGWLGLTQNPANNPLGFNMITTQELSDRQARSTQEALNELNWGDGFLSQKKCVEPANYTPKNAKNNPCLRWQTVTPGIAISNQLSNAMGSSYRQLEMADQINESMSLVFDALANQAMVWGVSELTKRRDPSFATYGGPGLNRVYDSLGVDITNSQSRRFSTDGQLINAPRAGGWFDVEEQFDITGLTGSRNNLISVIQTQENYLKALRASQAELPKIVPQIAELDYCIPGPNPNWENEVLDRMEEQYELMARIDARNVNTDIPLTLLPEWWQKLNTIPILGLAPGIVGGLVDFVGNIFRGESKEDRQNRLLAIQESEISLQEDLINFAEIFQKGVEEQKLKEYKQKLHSEYGNSLTEKNIPVAAQANSIVSLLANYQSNVADAIPEYQAEISKTSSNIAELKDIKRKIDALLKKQDIQYCAAPPADLNDVRQGGGTFNPVNPGSGGGTVLPGPGSGTVNPGAGTGSGPMVEIRDDGTVRFGG
jgi:hypothetical protein